MDYKRRDNYYIVDIIEKAIKTLNDKKGTKFRLTNATFDVGVDDKHGAEWPSGQDDNCQHRRHCQ